MSSLSSWLMPATKKRLAYLIYFICKKIAEYNRFLIIFLTLLPSIYNLLVYIKRLDTLLFKYIAIQYLPLYSRKLHIFTRRANTSCVASFTILAFSLGGIVTNHFVRRTFPCLLTNNNQFIYTFY